MPTRPQEQKKSEQAAGQQKSEPKKGEWKDTIGAVTNYLKFLTLALLVVNATLGAVALKTEGTAQLTALYGAILMFVLLVGVIVFFARTRPEALFQSDATSPALQTLRDFCERVSGHWWQKITPKEPSAISFFSMSADRLTGTVRMKGTAYGEDGKGATEWETVATCVDVNAGKIFYYWKGNPLAAPQEEYRGFGEFTFWDSLEGGSGFFSDAKLSDLSDNKKKRFDFYRGTDDEAKDMRSGVDKVVSERILKRFPS